MGTPAEEGGGGKVFMIERGRFNRVDVAIMAHPGPGDSIININNARVALEEGVCQILGSRGVSEGGLGGPGPPHQKYFSYFTVVFDCILNQK